MSSVDRSYLPFASARLYQDRGMAKWLGFYLSEFTTAFTDFNQRVTLPQDLPLEEKLLSLSQLYTQQLKARIGYISGKEVAWAEGKISNLSRNDLVLETEVGFVRLDVDTIRGFEVEGGSDD